VVHDKVDCVLPPLPSAAVLGGVPDPDGYHYVLTVDGLAELARYIGGLQNWIKAADGCLKAATP